MTAKPSVVLMGSKPGSVVALSLLLARDWDVRAVVPSGTQSSPSFVGGPTLDAYARSRGLPVVEQRELQTSQPVDFVISYMYRNLVRPPALQMARRGAMNFHAGPLPQFGGWAFYNVAILENASEYGCTCHYMDEGFDTGPLFRVRRFPIDASEETAVTLERKAQEEMIRLFIEFCDLAESGEPLPREEQDPSQHRYMNREEFEALKRVPNDADAETIDRHARAFWYPPYQCAYLEIGAGRVELVPAAAKAEIAELMHASDLERLLAAVNRHSGQPASL